MSRTSRRLLKAGAVLGALLTIGIGVRGQATTGEAAGSGAPPSLAVGAHELAVGSIQCFVNVVDPPNGTGMPEGYISFGFDGTAGIRQSRLEVFHALGSGEGLDQACVDHVGEVESLARQLGCQTGGVQVSTSGGENFRTTTRYFEFACGLPRDRVIEALSAFAGRVFNAAAAPAAG